MWWSGNGFTNPITGDQISSIIIANADTATGTELKVGALRSA